MHSRSYRRHLCEGAIRVGCLVRRRGVEQGRIFFASSALHRALGERQRFWFWADAFLKRQFFLNFPPKKSTLCTKPFRLAPPPDTQTDATPLGIGGLLHFA